MSILIRLTNPVLGTYLLEGFFCYFSPGPFHHRCIRQQENNTGSLTITTSDKSSQPVRMEVWAFHLLPWLSVTGMQEGRPAFAKITQSRDSLKRKFSVRSLKSLSITERPWWCHKHPTCATFFIWLNKQPSARGFRIWPDFCRNVVLIKGLWLFIPSGNSVKCFTFLIENNCLYRLRSQVLNCGVSGLLLFLNVSMRKNKKWRRKECKCSSGKTHTKPETFFPSCTRSTISG